MKYVAPTSVDDATALLASEPDAQVFAGATDVIPQMRSGRPEPSVLVDLKKIPELTGVTLDGDRWRIGAATPASVISSHADFAAAFPGVAEAAHLIGSDQVQSRASLGGNLCNASPAADTVPAMVAVGMQAVVAGPDGVRTVPVAEVPTGPGRTSLAAGEFLVELQVDRPTAGTSDAYLRFTPRTEMDIAVVGAGASVTVDGSGTCTAASVALGAVAPTVVTVPAAAAALVGTTLDEAALDAAATAARAACAPIDDKRGTVAFRVHVAGVLTARAVTIAADRAGGAR